MFKNVLILMFSALLISCGGDDDSASLSEQLTSALVSEGGSNAFLMPGDGDYTDIPQDPNNPITAEKVALGQLLYHETALATAGNNPSLGGTWSCASCHHVAAGFKSGIPQGIAEGGEGFGDNGEGRVMADNFDPASADTTLVPDTQPLTSPAVLNTAYQEVMLWNGQFGNQEGGVVNAGLENDVLMTAGTPKAENVRALGGIEIQAIAGLGVHRMNVETDSVLQTNPMYQDLFNAAYPDGSTDVLEDAGKAIAAFERTILANQSPFQLWLKGDDDAMNDQQKRGAILFFGKAACVDCHRGPALSSAVGASESEVFFDIGFNDFDTSSAQIHGSVDDATSRGRGGFTGEDADNFKFKIPQLYNLIDTDVFGHGASFSSVREVIEYKNAGVVQRDENISLVDSRFTALGLTEAEMTDLQVFIEDALYDPGLQRYVPFAIPTGNCFPVADGIAIVDLGC